MYLKKQRTQKILLSLSLSLSILLSSCTHAERKPFAGKIYVGDSAGIQIKGNGFGMPVACEAKEFDNYVCMQKDDFKNLIDGLLTPKK